MSSESTLPLEEHDWAGYATGIEAELPDEETPEHIQEPFDPEKIDVVTRNPTVDLLLSRLRSGAIDLEPDFQRRPGIWTEERQSRLIESLLLRIPLPTLYAAENADEQWAIVDGIQRLTAIARFIDPTIIGARQLLLQDLEYLGKDYNGAAFVSLPPRLQTRLRETELVLHLIRHGTPEPVKFNIFARINTGGMPLSAQELRNALIPGQARTYLRDWASSQQFKVATDGSINDERMADREMVLRFVAFFLERPERYAANDFDEFLRRGMRKLNGMSPIDVEHVRNAFLDAMEASTEIFGADAFRKRYRLSDNRYPINKALFETVSVNLALLGPIDREVLKSRSESVRSKFMVLMTDTDFDRAISQGTGDIAKVRLRFSRLAELFADVLQ